MISNFNLCVVDSNTGRKRKALRKPVMIWIMSEPRAIDMRRCANQWLKDAKWKTKLPRTRLGSCIENSCSDGLLMYLVCVSGKSRAQRIGMVAHEGMHLVTMFFQKRGLPSGGEALTREEHRCRMLESLVSFYVDVHEGGA